MITRHCFFFLQMSILGHILIFSLVATIPVNGKTQTTTVSTSPNQCNVAQFSSYPRPYVSHGSGPMPTACFLNTAYNPKCTSWRVALLSLLKNNTPFAIEQRVQNFMYGVAKNCDTNSEAQVYTPSLEWLNKNCSRYYIGSQSEPNFMQYVLPGMSFLPDGQNGGKTMEQMLENFMNCTQSYPLGRTEGGAFFVVTNIPCNELCTMKLIVMQDLIFNTILMNGYVVKVMYLDDDHGSTECVQSIFSTCNDQIASVCDVTVYNETDNSLDACINDMITCEAPPKRNGNPMTPAEMALAISVPTICSFIVFAVCGICCYKRWKSGRLARNDGSMHRKFEADFQKAIKGQLSISKLTSEVRPTDGWELSRDKLEFSEDSLLGSGAFANVYKGKLTGKIPLLTVHASLNLALENQTDADIEVAIKRLPGNADSESRTDFYQEIQFMKNLGFHTHIISMLGCVSFPPDPLIVVEYCSHGDLLTFVRKHREHVLMTKDDLCPIDAELCLRIKDLVSIAWQVCDGLNYLSSHNYIHRDVAARNVFITNKLVAKVGDFGLCRHTDSALYTAKGGRLPIKWMAIESLKFYDFSTKSDVWSFGVLLFELFSMGEGPYPAIQPEEMFDHLLSGNRLDQPMKCPNEIYDIMKNCWMERCVDRPHFSQIRSELTVMLNMEDEHYGYIDVTVNNPTSRNLKDMIFREVSTFHVLNEVDDVPDDDDELQDENEELQEANNHSEISTGTEEKFDILRRYLKDTPSLSNSSGYPSSEDSGGSQSQDCHGEQRTETCIKVESFIKSVKPENLWKIEKMAKEFRLQSESIEDTAEQLDV